MFYHFLINASKDVTLKINNQFKKIYILYLLALILEIIINYSYGWEYLNNYFPGGPGITGYRSLESRTFIGIFNINISGLNSLILGPQASSMITLSVLIWFFPLFKDHSSLRNIHVNKKWFFISFLFFMLSPTMTANLLFIIFIIIAFFLLKGSIYNSFKSKIVLATIVATGGIIILKFLFTHLFNPYQLSRYTWGFTEIIYAFNKLPIKHQLFGIPAYQKIGDFTATIEFGFYRLFFDLGFLFVFIIFVILTIVFYKIIRSPQVKNRISNFYLSSAKRNIIIVMIWFLSLMHYQPALEIGAVQLIAFHLSVALLNFNRSKQLARILDLPMVEHVRRRTLAGRDHTGVGSFYPKDGAKFNFD